MTATVATRRDWMKVGERFAPCRDQIEREIAILTWEPVEGPKAMAPALGIKATIEELRIPKVSQVALDGYVEVCEPGEEGGHYALYGIEGHYANGRVRLYVIDTGTEIVPICADVFEGD